jgi:hypothetical protein
MSRFAKTIRSIDQNAKKRAYDLACRIAKRAFELSPVDTGQHRSSIGVGQGETESLNRGVSAKGPHIPKFDPKGSGNFSVYSSVEYASTLEYGLYPNPGQPHFSYKKIGIVLRATPRGYIVLRTTAEGYSNRAKRGVIKEAFNQIVKKL